MLEDLNGKAINSEFRREKLPDHWGYYFQYEKNEELYNLTQEKILIGIEEIKTQETPLVDSQRFLGNILNELGPSHTFFRQFNEMELGCQPGSVLGMQLYKIMSDDRTTRWIYHDTKNSGHKFPHASYFMNKG